MKRSLPEITEPKRQKMGTCQSIDDTTKAEGKLDKAELAPSKHHIKDDFQSKKGGTALLLIDPQVDFHEGGSLAVPGANEDAIRLARMIEDNRDAISQITVTLDSHQKLHIANPYFWKGKDGARPDPFTLINPKDIEEGTWTPAKPTMLDHSLSYVKQLEANKRFVLCIWPEHCLIGTPGHSVVPAINTALQSWAGHSLDTINYIFKGQCALTEMYSGLQADVPVASDPSTEFNHEMLAQLQKADRVVVCGQALSHCVNFTMRDLVSRWPQDRLKDLVLLSDGASSVPGFEKAGEDFVNEMVAKGCRVCTAAEAFA